MNEILNENCNPFDKIPEENDFPPPLPEVYEAEIAALNKKISDLKEHIDKKNTLDPQNPFENPAEYHHYNSDYTKIVPQVAFPGCKIPIEPNLTERKKIRRFYNIAGINLILSLFVGGILMQVLYTVAKHITAAMNPDATPDTILNYLNGSSLLVAVNMVGFLFCHMFFGWLGLKMAKTKPRELVRTRDFGAVRGIQYCSIAMFLQIIAIIMMLGVTQYMAGFGLRDWDVSGMFDYNLPTGKLLSAIYGCIIAPVCEEFFYRGMLLKNLSKANQRFAIFMTAVLFGLGHHNIAQFSLGFVIGIFLAHITIKHNSIIPAIIVHMFNNSMSYLYSEFHDINKYPNASSLLDLAFTVLPIIGFIMFIDFRLKSKLPNATHQQDRRGISLALTSVPFFLALFAHIAYTAFIIVRSS